MTLERSKAFVAAEVLAALEARRVDAQGCPAPHQVGQAAKT
jgi:hypothetical protein